MFGRASGRFARGTVLTDINRDVPPAPACVNRRSVRVLIVGLSPLLTYDSQLLNKFIAASDFRSSFLKLCGQNSRRNVHESTHTVLTSFCPLHVAPGRCCRSRSGRPCG